MGQPIVVVEKPSIANPGIVRFETNRAITGMGHERYEAGVEVRGDRPPDELARRLLAHGGIASVHMNGSVITVDLAKGARTDGMREIIETLYIHYPASTQDPEVAVADAHAPESEGEAAEQVAAAPAEVAPDPKHTAGETAADVAVAGSSGPSASDAPAAPSSTSSAAARADDDEQTEADVQAAEGDAPTRDQAPAGGTASDPPADDPTVAPADAGPDEGSSGEESGGTAAGGTADAGGTSSPVSSSSTPSPSTASSAGAPGADTNDPEKAAEAAAVDEARASERAGETDDLEAARTTASGTDPDADSSRPPASAAARAPLDPGENP